MREQRGERRRMWREHGGRELTEVVEDGHGAEDDFIARVGEQRGDGGRMHLEDPQLLASVRQLALQHRERREDALRVHHRRVKHRVVRRTMEAPHWSEADAIVTIMEKAFDCVTTNHF